MAYFKDRHKGEVALVTGGASGIGLAISKRLLAEGAKVVLTDIDSAKLQLALDQLIEFKDQIDGQVLDVTDEHMVRAVFDQVARSYGKLDICVNSAGVVGPTSTNILEFNIEDYRKVLDINLTGSFNIIKQSVEIMLPKNYGRILMLASIAGKEGNPGMSAYSSSKAGVIGLVKGVAKEYAETQITINALAPAVIATPMNLETSKEQLSYMTSKIPMARLGTTDEVASLACWVVSKESSFNTGVVFDISGGRATY